MKRSDFLRSLLGAGALSKAEQVHAAKNPNECACGSNLISGLCIHTKSCYNCKQYKHFPQDRCETCGNGYLPPSSFTLHGAGLSSCATFSSDFYKGYEILDPKPPVKRNLRKL